MQMSLCLGTRQIVRRQKSIYKMAAKEDWEQSLRNILQETEANISSLKRNMTPKQSSTPYARGHHSGLSEGQSLYFTPTNASYMPTRASQPTNYYKSSAPQLDRSASLTVSLSKRIEQLEQTIQSLNNTVMTLQYEIKVQNEETKKLKDELKHVTKRLHEKGVDMGTEQKLKVWQREVRSELDAIQSLMKMKAESDDYNTLNDVTVISLSKDVSDSKRLLREETDLIRRELDNLGTRILKLENEAASFAGESKDLGMRQVRLERDMSSINDGYRSQSRIFSKMEKESLMTANEMDSVRQEIDNLHEALRRIVSKSEVQQKEKREEHRKDARRKQEESFLRKPLEFKEKSTKKDFRYSSDPLHNDLDDSFDLSLTSDLDDLSLNTSLNLSDEIDTLSLDILKRKF